MYIESLIRLLFPSKCVICKCHIDQSFMLEICQSCYSKLPFLSSVESNILKHSGIFINETYSPCHYFGVVQHSIKQFKFQSKPSLFRFWGKIAANHLKKMTNPKDFDIIIYVPLHEKRLFERGYNQSKLLATEISKELKRPLCDKAIKRVKHTNPQSTLTKKQRETNLLDAFIAIPEKVRGKKILLVDDVMTTGSTLEECSKNLKVSGAKSVTAIVLATGRKFY